jgi:P27 family predicted phage terminase small subunit
LRLRGSWRANINPDAPEPPVRTLKCPKNLDKTAKKIWRRTARDLQACGLLTCIDEQALERYCYLRSLLIRTQEFIDKTGGCHIEFETLPDGRKTIKRVDDFPHIDRLLKIAAALHRLEDSFGMNPSSRTRISVPKDETCRDRNSRAARFFRDLG